MKLGRNSPYSREEKPRVYLDNYLLDTVTVPHVVDRASKVGSWPMYLNDQLGDCTCAAVGHALQAWTAYASNEVDLSDNEVLGLYEAVGGYVPGDPSTDNGAVIQDVLQYWHDNGVAGHKISAFAELKNFYSMMNLKKALYLFGTVYFGINLPVSAMDQFNQGLPWYYVAGSSIDGGHAVVLQKQEAVGMENGIFNVVTWGQLQPMTVEFMLHYVEEAWVMITPDWLEANGKTVTGLSLAQLMADFNSLA